MPSRTNFWTTKHPDGWAVRREGSTKATSIHPTQTSAWQETRQRARDAGGEAYLQDREGHIRERNTYGRDPTITKG